VTPKSASFSYGANTKNAMFHPSFELRIDTPT
jgi:hypothetical protein